VKIGVFDPFPGKTSVGIQTYTRKIANALSKFTSVVVYTSNKEYFTFANIDVRIIAPSKINSHFKRFLWEQLCLPKIIKTDCIDLLFMPLPEVPVLTKIPVVAVVHDLLPIKMSKYHSFKYKLFFYFALQTLRKARFIVTDSINTSNDFKKLAIAKNIKVIYPGVNKSQRSQIDTPFSRYKPYILYIGGFAPYKNVLILLEAYSNLAKELPHRLIIAGWGAEKQLREIIQVIKSLHLEQKVVNLSWIAEEELFWLYSNCECFIFPSLYEGFGLPVLEAMSCGAPTICSNTSSLPEVCGEAVIYFNPFRKDELVTNIKKVVSDIKLQNQLREKGLLRSKLFTWEKTVSELFNYINSNINC